MACNHKNYKEDILDMPGMSFITKKRRVCRTCGYEWFIK
jgi:hypothetical protein